MIGPMLLAAALLAAGQPAVPVRPGLERQVSPAARARHEICYVLATGAAHLNLASCLSFGDAPEPVFRAEVCNFLRDTGQLEDFEFASHAQCLRDGFVR